MTVLRAEVRITADGQVLVADTAEVDTDSEHTPWMRLMAELIDLGAKAHARADFELTAEEIVGDDEADDPTLLEDAS